MNDFGLYVIITDPVVPHERIVEACVANGILMVQLREKEMDDRMLLEKAKNIAGIVKGSSTRFIMNDRIDIAMLCGADGTHVGQDDIPVSDLRSIAGDESHILGLSTHSVRQACDANRCAPDYIGFGPVFPTYAKKRPDPAVGLTHIRQVVERSPVPVVVIGGINRTNIDDVLDAGAKNIAMISALCRSSRYEDEIRFFAEKVREHDTVK
ncbi:MAG: thiamine phosphate synthase [Spirochaetota bacterium]